MANTSRNKCKATVLKVDTTDKLHEDYMLKIWYEIEIIVYKTISYIRIVYQDKHTGRIKNQCLTYKWKDYLETIGEDSREE